MTDVRRLAIVVQTQNYLVLHNGGMMESIVIGNDGWVAYIRDASLHGAIQIRDGCLIPVHHEYNIDLSDRPLLAKTINDALDATGRFPLMALVDELVLRDRLLHPAAIEQGYLYPQLQAIQAGQAKRCEGFVWARASYHRFVPQRVKYLLDTK